MAEMARFQEILHRLAIIDERFIDERARLGAAAVGDVDPKVAALVRVGVLVALGSPAVLLEWSISGALAAGATEDEITDVLLAITPVIGLRQVVSATPDVADALGYDIEAALDDPDGH